jgi:hypothetical protein
VRDTSFDRYWWFMSAWCQQWGQSFASWNSKATRCELMACILLSLVRQTVSIYFTGFFPLIFILHHSTNLVYHWFAVQTNIDSLAYAGFINLIFSASGFIFTFVSVNAEANLHAGFRITLLLHYLV